MRVPALLTSRLRWALALLLQVQLWMCAAAALIIATISATCFQYGVYNYPHIPRQQLPDQLYKKVTPSLPQLRRKPPCDYTHILDNPESINAWEVLGSYENFSPAGLVNGSFAPTHCNAQFSVAIIITYRDRQKQLDIFLPYMHNFLRKQDIHYKIFLVEQQDEELFNKGLLYNTGAQQAIAEGFPCLVLHDVDLLPLDAANLYACVRQPRHMSASLDKFRFVLLYEWLVGGVLAIQADQYILTDGFSNCFEGWGGEDDDFYERMTAKGLSVVRLAREMSRYTMVPHAPAAPRHGGRRDARHAGPATRDQDGLHALRLRTRPLVRADPLATRLIVRHS